MKRTHLLKCAAVGSALLLAAGYICFRAGAFGHSTAATNLPAATDTSPTLMHGSKSIDIVINGNGFESTSTPPAIPSVIDKLPCD